MKRIESNETRLGDAKQNNSKRWCWLDRFGNSDVSKYRTVGIHVLLLYVYKSLVFLPSIPCGIFPFFLLLTLDKSSNASTTASVSYRAVFFFESVSCRLQQHYQTNRIDKTVKLALPPCWVRVPYCTAVPCVFCLQQATPCLLPLLLLL